MPSSMFKDNNFQQQQQQPNFINKQPRKMHYVDISTDDTRDEDATKLIMNARKGLRKSNTKNLQDQEVRSGFNHSMVCLKLNRGCTA